MDKNVTKVFIQIFICDSFLLVNYVTFLYKCR